MSTATKTYRNGHGPLRRRHAYGFCAALFTVAFYAAEACAVVEPAGATGPRAEPLAAGNMLQLTLGLLVVLAAIGASVWALRRFGRFQSGADGALKIVGGLSLGTRERVVLMQVGDTQLLLGVAPGRVETLHVLDRHVPDGQMGRGPGQDFVGRLHAVMQGVPRGRKAKPSN